ncbi:Phr family secreted Rap phosphatase inhibitor [Bacillus mycoides]|uniref:Phr family secreted Rap phosphatase inhibitor n=1 Tax=Bacillus mycoides TaxID=1405 RepID=UPI000BF1E05D|nr:Phr family secreted Rap phosphatase inhibitor [Bacillus mycoides]PEK91021.1 Phr family secreted Rap phosphatase inhibitor [Bacillus mycoides]
MKKLSLMVMSLAVTGITVFTINTTPKIQQTATVNTVVNKLQSTHGEGWSPTRPELVYLEGRQL